jgi:flagellar protein FlaC
MGKDEGELVKDTVDNKSTTDKKSVDKFKSEINENISNNSNNQTEDKKIDKEELRKVIKIGEQNKVNNTQKLEKEVEHKKILTSEMDLDLESRGDIEQKRAILHSIKDFDFLIKKNSEEITSLNKKIDSITKDLDDLVSLYEIVSEQMNPFVGLSKVTKKRLDTLENFNEEIESLKTRIGDIEIFVEKNGTGFKSIKLQENEDNIPDLSNQDLDKIIENSFSDENIDQKIDEVIEEFIKNLKNVL